MLIREHQLIFKKLIRKTPTAAIKFQNQIINVKKLRLIDYFLMIQFYKKNAFSSGETPKDQEDH
jgi:hypothetical protein